MSAYPTIRVHIESLVVNGLGSLPRFTLRDQIAAALQRQLGESALETLPWTTMHRTQATAPAFEAGPGLNVATIGSRIASAVHGEIVPR